MEFPHTAKTSGDSMNTLSQIAFVRVIEFLVNILDVSGVICAEYSEEYSHWNSSKSLHQWMKDEGIVGITGIDTRELTQKIRTESTMLGKIIIDDDLPLNKDLFKENM